jgi:hypothetical protein
VEELEKAADEAFGDDIMKSADESDDSISESDLAEFEVEIDGAHIQAVAVLFDALFSGAATHRRSAAT